MNDHVNIILHKLVQILEKKHQWKADPDWELTLKTDGYIPMSRHVTVQGNMDNKEWKDQVETGIMISLKTDDQVTFFPQAVIDATINITGGGIHTIQGDDKMVGYTIDGDVAFTDDDFDKDAKIIQAAEQLNDRMAGFIQHEYSDYIDTNYDSIKGYGREQYEADQENWKERDH